MIDNFSLGLTHALLLYAAWRLVHRPDLNDEAAPLKQTQSEQKRGWGRK